jgi:hypothetical protein
VQEQPRSIRGAPRSGGTYKVMPEPPVDQTGNGVPGRADRQRRVVLAIATAPLTLIVGIAASTAVIVGVATADTVGATTTRRE